MTAGVFSIRRFDGAAIKPLVWIRLMKLRISLMAAAATLTGFLLYRPAPDVTTVLAVSGVFLLAAGAAALNHYQDRDIDRLCARTCDRPLPRRLIASRQAILFAAFLGLAGLLVLSFMPAATVPLLLGLLAVVIYNGIYTPLKKKTSLALLPGSLGGMLPPLIGWVAAGGSVLTLKIWVLMAVLGLWQMPHFWLLLLSQRQDHRHAALPSLLGALALEGFKRIVFVWTLAFTVTTLTLPLVHVVITPWLGWLLVTCGAFLLAYSGFVLLKPRPGLPDSILFKLLNMYMGLILVLVALDNLAIG